MGGRATTARSPGPPIADRPSRIGSSTLGSPHDRDHPSPPWHGILAIEPRSRGGRPAICGMRIAAGDVPGRPASSTSHIGILEDIPDPIGADIRAVLAHAAERGRVAATTAHQGGVARSPGRARPSHVRAA